MLVYKKNPAVPVVVIPGHGVVNEGDEIEGDYDRYVPFLLHKVEARAKVALPPTLPAPPEPPDPAPDETRKVPAREIEAVLAAEISEKSKKKGKR